MIPRRGLLAGLGALLAAPAIIRTPGLLMPVRPVVEPQALYIAWANKRLLVFSTYTCASSMNRAMEFWLEAAAQNGAIIERRVVGAPEINGISSNFIAMDEAADISDETWHAMPLRGEGA